MDNEQLLRLLNETREDISRAESKASIALGAAGLVSGSVMGELFARYPSLTTAGQISMIACVAAVIAGLVSLGLALIPNVFANPGGHQMLAFFGHVMAAGSLTAFEQMAEEPQDERQRLTNQIWTLSTLIMRKYAHIRRAFLALGLAVALGVVTMLVELAFG